MKENWNKNVFESEDLYLRFIIPTDISIEYCDFNLESPCIEIQNIIRPAPYDIKNRIDTNRLIIVLSLFTVGFASVAIWSRIRKEPIRAID